jgi:hypothetical protein
MRGCENGKPYKPVQCTALVGAESNPASQQVVTNSFLNLSLALNSTSRVDVDVDVT